MDIENIKKDINNKKIKKKTKIYKNKDIFNKHKKPNMIISKIIIDETNKNNKY
jgi:hypothetical protein